MRYLTIEEYAESERRALQRLPNQSVGAAFQRSRSDHVQENFFADYFNQILRGLTPDEFDDLQAVLAAVCDFTEDYFGKVSIASGPLLQGMNVLRHIGFLPFSVPPRVLELGPGAGCLGAGLMFKGYPYASVEVTQAFYLYQNRFFTHLSEGKLVDGVLSNAAPGELLTYIPKGGSVHIPWWQFAELTPQEMPAFDIVICDHAFCEMNESGLRFPLFLAKTALSKSGEAHRAFIFQGWGQSSQHDRAAATRLLYDFGFRLVQDGHNVVVFVPADSTADVGRAITDGRAKIRDYQYVGVDQLETLFTVILGSDQQVHHYVHHYTGSQTL
jgi:hypothetical protein